MINENHITKDETMTALNISLPSRAAAPKLSLMQRILSFETLRKERVELSKLSDAQLKDIGITPDQARKEARRPAWDLPENWQRRQ